MSVRLTSYIARSLAALALTTALLTATQTAHAQTHADNDSTAAQTTRQDDAANRRERWRTATVQSARNDTDDNAQRNDAQPIDDTVATTDTDSGSAHTLTTDSTRTDSTAATVPFAPATVAPALDDSLTALIDSIYAPPLADSVYTDSVAFATALADSLYGAQKKAKKKRDWSTWRPDPQRAMWLALVLPGAGQIYNRKYWKLPIFYGGIMGCIYAMTWNNMMYKDYSQAYLDIMDDDPTTESYNKFLHLGKQITSSNEERYKEIFKSRKDKYRRWRDLAFFCLIGVYALSVIDAYVDAQLSEFDISDDLSLRVEPAVMIKETKSNTSGDASVGLQCSLTF